MVRWEPGARDRLRVAALTLFESQGFDSTTTAQIATSAGLTERSFFRLFADKREVLFDGSETLASALVEGVSTAPETSSTSDLATAALFACAALFSPDGKEWSRRRRAVIGATPALQERELLKFASYRAALETALTDRRIAPLQAALLARATMTVFKVAFDRWLVAGEHRSLADVTRTVLRAFAGLLDATSSTPSPEDVSNGRQSPGN